MIALDIPMNYATHEWLEGDIVHVVLLENVRGAVDDYINLLDTYWQAHLNGQIQLSEPIKILVEIRQRGMIPLPYTVQRYTEFMHKYERLPDSKVAYLYSGGFIPSLVESFLNLLPHRNRVQRRFYHASRLSEALAWLRG